MKSIPFFYISLIVVVQACGQTRFQLKEDELKYLPYKGNEILMFESSLGDRDTIWLRNYRSGFTYTQAGYHRQIVSIHGNFSNPNPPGNKHEYLYGRLFELNAAIPGKEGNLGIFLMAKNAVFYGPDYLTISQLKESKKIEIKLLSRTIKDVIVIRADTTSKLNQNFKLRANFVDAVYWSETEGLLRYDKRDGEVWIKAN